MLTSSLNRPVTEFLSNLFKRFYEQQQQKTHLAPNINM